VVLAAEKLGVYSGHFRSEELLATYTIGVQDGKLVLQNIQIGDGFMRSSEHLTLRAAGPDIFEGDDQGLEFIFERDSSGKVQGFTLEAGRTRGLTFKRK
jgi:hypothetical protein